MKESPREIFARVKGQGVTIDINLFRQLMSSFAAGVTVITAVKSDGEQVGLTATAVCSLSANPPLILVSVDNGAESLPAMKEKGSHFVVNFLSAGQADLARKFATKDKDKYALGSWHAGQGNIPMLDGALACVECTTFEVLPGGDHSIVEGEIIGGETNDQQPLLYYRRDFGRFAV